MTSNIRLFHDVDTRDVVLTGTAAVSTLPVTNLLTAERTRLARWTETEFEVIGTYPVMRIIDSLALVRTNLSAGSEIRFEVFADAEHEELLFDTGWRRAYPIAGWGEFAWGEPLGVSVFSGWPQTYATALFDPLPAHAWRLSVKDPLRPTTHTDIGRAIVGLSVAPERWSSGVNIGWRDNGQQRRTAGGSIITESNVEPYRRIEISLEALSQADRNIWLELQRRLGSREDFFITVTHNARDNQLARDGSMHGKFASLDGIRHLDRDLFQTSLIVEEC